MNKKAQVFVARNLIELCLVVASVLIFLSCTGKVTNIFMGDSGTLPERTFLAFIEDIKDLSNSNVINLEDQSELFLEDGQAVVYFEPYQQQMEVGVEVDHSVDDYKVFISRPNTCEGEKGCLCFVKAFEFKTSSGIPARERTSAEDFIFFADVTITENKCVDLEQKITLSNCGIGLPNDADAYICNHGFIIERHLMKEIDDDLENILDEYYTTPQNLILTLTNEANGISIKPRVLEDNQKNE